MHHRVFWHQGALLKPQMFQQQDRAFEHMLAQSMLQPRSVNWGLTELQWDEAALSAGTIALRKCSGYFPIGTGFAAPAEDRLPSPVTPDASQRSGFIYLTMPIAHRGLCARRRVRTMKMRPALRLRYLRSRSATIPLRARHRPNWRSTATISRW